MLCSVCLLLDNSILALAFDTLRRNGRDSVADPGFSPGGAPTPKNAIIFQFFAENCMKMKEFGPPGGGARPWRPPWIRQWDYSETLGKEMGESSTYCER